MLLDQETLRYIFGFKLRGFRQEKNLSLKDLAKLTGLSPSYINEIENGKKYPKSEKIMALAHSLGVSYDELISIKLKKEMGMISAILEKNLLHGLPFDVLGVPAQTLFELMAQRPVEFSALIGTLLELARIHNIKVEDFFAATMRAQIDMQSHYFADLEDSTRQFKLLVENHYKKKNESAFDFNFSSSQFLSKVLKEVYGCDVEEKKFGLLDANLRGLHFVFIAKPKKKFLLNSDLSEREKIFVLAKEIGHQFLKHKERSPSSFSNKSDSYEKVFNNFKASYFAGSLLIPKEKFIEEIKTFFSGNRWNEIEFKKWVESYPGSYSCFFYRLTQILPTFFKLDQMFFLRFGYNTKTKQNSLQRELHLADLHAPHSVKTKEHYCQRWITTSLLKDLTKQGTKELAGVQRSRFWGTNEEYLCFCFAFDGELSKETKDCVTVGLRVNDRLKEVVKFLDDPKIPIKQVADTCERCGITSCEDREAPPSMIEKVDFERDLQLALEKISASPGT